MSSAVGGVAGSLDGIRARLAKATPAPWFVVGLPWLDEDVPPYINAGSPDPHHDGFVCDMGNMATPDAPPNVDADAEFIAAAPSDVARLLAAVDAVLALHQPLEWHECGDDGTPDLTKPLPTFCSHCTDEDYVSAIEAGDTIDASASVISWPCPTVRAVAAHLDPKETDR